MKKIYLLLSLVFSFGCTKTDFSQDVAPEPDQPSYKISVDSLKQQALELQSIFGDETTKSRTLSVKNVTSINQVLFTKGLTKSVNSDPEAPQAYVVNFADEAGFAILADDKRMVNNVLAYSEDGNIDATVDNPGLLMFLEDANSYLGVVGANFYPIPPKFLPVNYEPNRNIKPSNWGVESQGFVVWSYRGAVEFARKSKMVSVNWKEGSPYDQYLKVKMESVTTAMIQLMSYYEKPTSVVVDGINRTINWSLAKSGSVASSNLPYLVRSITLAYRSDPGDISWSTPINPQDLFEKHAYTSTLDRASVPPSQIPWNIWDIASYDASKIITELDNNRPVIVQGGTGDGRYWVVDGYIKLITDYVSAIDYVNNESYWEPNNVYQVGQRLHPMQSNINHYLHLNWGWGGQNNGYFLTFEPNNGIEYDSSNPQNNVTYNDNKKLLYNIKPL